MCANFGNRFRGYLKNVGLPDHGPERGRIVIDYRFPSAAKTGTVIAASNCYNLRRVIAV